MTARKKPPASAPSAPVRADLQAVWRVRQGALDRARPGSQWPSATPAGR